MAAIWKLAKKHKLFVIEDAAHAAGTLYRGRKWETSSHQRRGVLQLLRDQEHDDGRRRNDHRE